MDNIDITKCPHLLIQKKYKQCLDEIERIVLKGVKIHDDIIVNKQILQLIKQAKEGGEQ